MKDTTAAHLITREEIEEAMKEFLKKGGKIQVLPPQVFIKRIVVGDSNLMAYEDPEMIVSRK